MQRSVPQISSEFSLEFHKFSSFNLFQMLQLRKQNITTKPIQKAVFEYWNQDAQAATLNSGLSHAQFDLFYPTPKVPHKALP